jgi:hypothetical protein
MKSTYFAFLLLTLACRPAPRNVVRVEGKSTAVVSAEGRIVITPNTDTVVDIDIVKIISRSPVSHFGDSLRQEFFWPNTRVSIGYTPDPGSHSVRVWHGDTAVKLNTATIQWIIKKLWK